MNTRQVWINAVLTGREIEFRYGGRHYFESRTAGNWYIYCEETKETQFFTSSQELLENAALEGRLIHEIWSEICIDSIF